MYDLPIINNFNLNYLERIYYENDNFNISDSRILNLSISENAAFKSFISVIQALSSLLVIKTPGAYLSLNYRA